MYLQVRLWQRERICSPKTIMSANRYLNLPRRKPPSRAEQEGVNKNDLAQNQKLNMKPLYLPPEYSLPTLPLPVRPTVLSDQAENPLGDC